MVTITAKEVQELRRRTGSGMMECKKALTKTGGDIEKAVQIMRESGLAQADKKSSRTASEGMVYIVTSNNNKHSLIIEVNSETDFVSKGDDFQNFVKNCAKVALDSDIDNVDDLSGHKIDGTSIEHKRQELIAKVGENIQIRRIKNIKSPNGFIFSYLHGIKIGVIIEIDQNDADLGKSLSMHIAANKPLCVNKNDVDPKLLEQEKNILISQAQDSGKPADIIEKMVQGRLGKYLSEITLLGQNYLIDTEIKVQKLLKDKKTNVLSFNRLEVGEGIEKKKENFADEVAAATIV
ncbi:MAG: elongation factor Ts [Gammaproteobacteria bacterium]|nr:MAG: elongation factor Ts [Gammaproteobacteria bacterium]